MVSRRGIVIVILVGLTVIASSTQPWKAGTKLLTSKYESSFDPYFDMPMDASYTSVAFAETFNATGIRRVVIEAPAGSITVVRADDNSITVDGQRIAYGATVAEAEERLPLVQVETRTRDDVLEIIGNIESSPTSGVSGKINMVVQVPSGIEVHSTLSMGDIFMNEVAGPIHAKVDMGKVKTHSTSGDMDIKVSAGSIEIYDAIIAERLNLVASMGAIDFRGTLGKSNYVETSAGSISIRVPKSTCVRIDATASAGRIDSSLPITDWNSENTKSSATGILGEGTPTGELEIRASMGEISISEL